MAIPNAQLSALAHAGMRRKTKIGQQLGQHGLGVRILIADKAAHADVHTTGQGKSPGKSLLHKTEFKAGRAVFECSLTLQTHGHGAGRLHLASPDPELLRPG